MKSLFISISILFGLPISFAGPAHHHDQPSVHGMLMVGTSQVYLSHLPMFHSPHDYQGIFEVKLDEASHNAYAASLHGSTEKVYTLVPEIFVLPEMAKNPKVFKAKIYKGHFERGGTVIAHNVSVQISNVIHFEKFDPLKSQPVTGSYVLFGNSDEQFMAHLITAKPDFDQVLQVTVDAGIAEKLNQGLVLNFHSVKNSDPLREGEHLHAAEAAVMVESVLYLEFGDLSH